MNEFVNPDPVPHTAPMPPSPDLVLKHLPPIFRLQSLTRLPGDTRHVINRAVLCHERVTLTVEWVSPRVNVRFEAGCLVSVCWCGRPVSLNGAVRIARLVRLDRPEPTVNLFDTIPRTWGIDHALVKRAAVLWDGLPAPLAHLFNAIFCGQRQSSWPV